MQTLVINKRDNSFDVYIGRGSPFGSPFMIGKHGTREEVIALYTEYFLDRVEKDMDFRAQVLALKGKVLGCFCKPLACHGDVIASWLDCGGI